MGAEELGEPVPEPAPDISALAESSRVRHLDLGAYKGVLPMLSRWPPSASLYLDHNSPEPQQATGIGLGLLPLLACVLDYTVAHSPLSGLRTGHTMEPVVDRACA